MRAQTATFSTVAGLNEPRPSDSADVLINGKTWQALKSMPRPHEDGCVATIPGQKSTFYIVGGMHAYYQANKEIWKYNSDTNEYNLIGNLPGIDDFDGIASQSCIGFLFGPENRPVSAE